MAQKVEFSEVEIEALRELVDIAVELKKTGLLGMIKELLSDTESVLHAILSDTSTLKLVAMIGAVLEASRRLDDSKVPSLKKGVETTSYCLFESLSETDPAKAEPKGLMGAMNALRDPDVQKGLGFLLALAKNLGGCLRRQEKA